jgi:hypothetical protein
MMQPSYFWKRDEGTVDCTSRDSGESFCKKDECRIDGSTKLNRSRVRHKRAAKESELFFSIVARAIFVPAGGFYTDRWIRIV